MSKTTLYIHREAWAYLISLPMKKGILDFLNTLPHKNFANIWRHTDSRGREIEVKLVDRHAILFFTDPYAQIIKILDIRNIESK